MNWGYIAFSRLKQSFPVVGRRHIRPLGSLWDLQNLRSPLHSYRTVNNSWGREDTCIENLGSCTELQSYYFWLLTDVGVTAGKCSCLWVTSRLARNLKKAAVYQDKLGGGHHFLGLPWCCIWREQALFTPPEENLHANKVSIRLKSKQNGAQEWGSFLIPDELGTNVSWQPGLYSELSD